MEGEVLGEREVEDEPAALAVLGDVPDAVVEDLARARTGYVSPGDDDLSRRGMHAAR